MSMGSCLSLSVCANPGQEFSAGENDMNEQENRLMYSTSKQATVGWDNASVYQMQ
jgi:hypothetical protein